MCLTICLGVSILNTDAFLCQFYEKEMMLKEEGKVFKFFAYTLDIFVRFFYCTKITRYTE